MRRTAAVLAALILQGTRGINVNDTIEGYLGHHDIEVERHAVLTEDGYILEAHRLPRRGAPVVMLYHGCMGSSWIWLSNAPGLSVALLLYRQGYDVWLANSRGNIFSRHHKWLDRNHDAQYWNFTFVDFARYDLPATIEHALATTGRSTLTFIAHSEAALVFILANGMSSYAQRLDGKVNLFVALGPIAYVQHQQSVILDTIVEYDIVGILSDVFPLGVPCHEEFRGFLRSICRLAGIKNCKLSIGMLFGESAADSVKALLNHTAHFPSGTSMKNVRYYTQLHKSGRMEDFNYGAEGNLLHYGQSQPPRLSIGGLTVPTAFFFGTSDSFASPADAALLLEDFRGGNLIFSQEYEGFSHMTWIAGGAPSFRRWWPRVRGFLQVYNPVPGHVKPPPDTFLARA